ncbi:hypothetical protein PRIPAC_77778, partial [Pristionchus pacificus]|uniref:G protein-coupled receptor n=1 Tax=Pristionchus pacificus TaxID=54126 RepID=A0A2A6CJD2_PRIPA
ILPLCTDISYHFLLDPSPLLSLLCIYRWRPLIPIPGSVTIYYILWVLTIAWNACAYAACFIHRHQIVVPPGSFGKLSRRSQMLFLGASCAYSLLVAPILKQTSGFTTSELDRTVCYDTGWSYAFVGYSFAAFTISAIFLVLLTSHIFIVLRGAARIMSEKTGSFHRIMTKALVTQAAACFIFLLAPLIICYSIYIFDIDMSMLYILAFVSAHTLVHSAVVLGTTPLYRRALHELFSKGFGRPIAMTAHHELSILSHRRDTRKW